MKIKTAKAALIAGLMPLLFACNTKQEKPAEAAIDKDEIKKQIQDKENEFAATYNAREVKNIGYYAEDATSFYPNRPPLVGKQAILDFLTNDLGSSTDKIAFETKEVFVSGDANQVVEIGSFTVSDSVGNARNTGHYMTLFEKRNGKYVSVRDMSTSDMPER